MKANKFFLIGVSIAAAAVIAWWFLMRPSPRLLEFESALPVSEGATFSYEPYAGALENYVDGQGLVNYRELQANREALDDFAAGIGRLDPGAYEAWTEREKIAFWINAYNALTLEAIISHYPIKPSITASLLYPSNSIRQISGVWDRLNFLVMGRELTLDQIEHEILRREFNEPRIHVALVCAARGCPPLRNEPFLGERLDDQLDDQTRRFLSNPRHFRIDRDGGVVHLSSIFKWFGADFVTSFGVESQADRRDAAERAVLNYISGHLGADDAAFVASGQYSIQYLDYDWSLNEQGVDGK